jgi:hypothetical protein
MKRYGMIGLLGLLASCASLPQVEAPGRGTTYKVYFLGGQSNMEGFGFNSELPADIAAKAAPVPIYHGKTVEDGKDGGGVGIWSPMRPGHGTGFETDGTANSLSDRFGPELTFANTMSSDASNGPVAVIKFSRGGTGLVDGISGYGSWDPDYASGNRRNQYDNALTAIDAALRSGDIDGDGKADTLVPAGIVWMQGEADAYDNREAAENYDRNLVRLVGLLRTALGNENLPVVIGRIKDSGNTPETHIMTYSPQVQAAQARFVANDRCAALVTATDNFGFLPDGWHYRSEDYVVLGEAFALAMIALEKRCQELRY